MNKLTLLALAAASVVLAACGDNLTHPPDRSTYTETGSGGNALTCLPNLDGKVSNEELAAALDISVSYLIGKNRAVDLVGVTDGSGKRVWDFSKDYADDAKIEIAATSLVGRWYQASFPDGQWVAPADAAESTEGVYSADDQAIYLHGLASKEENPAAPLGKTLIAYKQKVAVYRFPLELGASWISVGEVENAMANGLPYTGTHTYEVKDDGTGELQLHDFTFTQAHRIRTTLTITGPIGADVVKRQTGFVSECFGEVLRATAAVDEPNVDFTQAAELRRVGQ